jgi:SAM domain (Sterile alpha motif)/Adenylate and Guanylate cyclase catalytic domain
MWSVAMDVGDWLKGLGLGQYEAAFREHEIDADILPDLTEADLEKIGLSLGARKRLIKGIAGLASKKAPPPETSARVRLQQTDSAERRHLSVMFCDLVGSTTISAGLDAEDWRNLVSAYLDAASEAVTQMGGRVAKKLGDGLMALFGHPIAQENDSERAVRAALAIQRRSTNSTARTPARAARSLSPASASTAGRSWSMRPEKSSGTRQISPRACRRWPSRAGSWSQLACSVRWRACSSPRIGVRMR